MALFNNNSRNITSLSLYNSKKPQVKIEVIQIGSDTDRSDTDWKLKLPVDDGVHFIFSVSLIKHL